MPSYGACSGQPPDPSPIPKPTFRKASPSIRRRAASPSSARISIVKTCATIEARITVWYPDPVPTSSTLSPGLGRSASVMNATM